jgi:Family of unknown function (DUF6629)
MCFSATASFTAAAVIGSVGIVTLRSAAAKADHRMLALAAFPMLFTLQQVVEGLLWLDLTAPAPGALRGVLVHAFQGYAEVFWPAFAPLAALLIERERSRRILISICLVIGVALSAYLLVAMIGHPYQASVGDGHIVYRNDFQYPKGIEAPYVVATTLSLLLSSDKHVQRLALVILIGFAVAYVSFHHAYISVWCFFAAIASVMVYLYVRAVPAGVALEATR